MSEDWEPVDLPDAECVGESQLALRIKYGERLYWIPKAVIHEDSEVYGRGDTGTLKIPRVIAEEKGLV